MSNLVKTDSTTDEMLDLITELQSSRMDSQRAELRPRPLRPEMPQPLTPSPRKGNEPIAKGASLPGLLPEQTTSTKPEDDFLDIIARVQGSRIEDQRSELPRPKPEERPKTVPDDDFFALIMRAQSGRMEDQRATIPLKENRANKSTSSKK